MELPQVAHVCHDVEVDHICEPLKPRYWEFGSPKVIGSKVKVRLKSAASRRLLIKFNSLRSREMTLPEAIPHVMPSQWQQSDPARHDDKFALLMKEFLSCRREEACSGRQGTVVSLLAAVTME
uniref:Uncharacterized protein n=1 Tax=Oryza rufipogon TaxID=4529 RepID=A0A0E0MRQ0_ORYRU